MRPDQDRDRFTAIFQALSPRVFAYARRRCDVATAEEIVADTFLVAWRRFDDLPPDPLPWLLVVARNTLSERRRGVQRKQRLTDTIATVERLAGHSAAADNIVIERASVLDALAELSDLEREALLLVAWEGLSNADAAVVAGCTQRAFEVRLSRARARLTREMTMPSAQSDPPPPLPIAQCLRRLIRKGHDMTERQTTENHSAAPNDPVRILTQLRPDEHSLVGEWDPARRDAVLACILAAEPLPVRTGNASRHRRLAAAGALAACAAVAVAGVVLPGGSPGGPSSAAAATLGRLAVTAGTAGREVDAGQYAYIEAREVQTFSAADVARGSRPITTDTFRTWTAPSGDAWRLQGSCLQRLPYDNLDTPAGGNYGGLNAAALAMLPTSTDTLATYLDEHPSGDNRDTRNRFNSVGDLVDSGLASPTLRAAAIRVLAHTDGVSVEAEAHDALGRDAIRVDYAEGDAVESLFFAPGTSALLESQIRENGTLDYRSVVQSSSVADALPDLPACG